jgi:hypothetical protein
VPSRDHALAHELIEHLDVFQVPRSRMAA